MSTYTALTKATYKANVRDVATVFFTFAFPLVFLVVFGTIFRGQEVGDTGHGYVDFIASGVLAWGMASAALFGVAFTLMQWRNDDLLRLIRLSPASFGSVIGARYTIALGLGLAQVVLFIGVAVSPFFGMRLGPDPLLVVPAVVAGVTAFMAIGVIIGSVANTPEAVAAISNCVVVPMAFLSGSFLPLDMMPDWLQSFSKVLPLRYLNDATAYSLVGAGSAGDYLVALAVLLGFSALALAVGAKVFRWTRES